MIITQEMLDICSPAQLNSIDERLERLHEEVGREKCFEDVHDIYNECLDMLFDQPQGEGYKYD